MNKLLQTSLFLFFMSISGTILAQNVETSKIKDAKAEKIQTAQVPTKTKQEKVLTNTEKTAQENKNWEQTRNSYLNSSIHTITSRKDSLLNIYGTFDAAKKAGALVK
ncbi:MAG: hypothetical protein GY810_19735 [Aureispira sp.]|nr:hypothetical protein [Aureispira sp.]